MAIYILKSKCYEQYRGYLGGRERLSGNDSPELGSDAGFEECEDTSGRETLLQWGMWTKEFVNHEQMVTGVRQSGFTASTCERDILVQIPSFPRNLGFSSVN